MSVTSYLLGVVLLAVTIVPLAVGAVRLRGRLVPAWSGAPARLAEIVIVLALLLAVLHILGSVGLFQRWAVAAAGAVVGALVVVLADRMRPFPTTDDFAGVDPDEATVGTPVDTSDGASRRLPPSPWWSVAGAGLLVAAVSGQWAAWVLRTWRFGITDYDSTNYHLPQAARFAQTGWITRLHLTTPEFPNMFHPADSELLHGLGMEVFQRDGLSPFLNVGWLAVVVLAAWCVGRPYRVAPLAVALVLPVLASPLMAIQAGSALTDISSAGLLLVAVAFLVQPTGGRGALALAGAATGMAMGIKLTLLAPAAALTVAVLVLVWRRGRWGAWLWWLLPLAGTGFFWYGRNLVHGGSPVPGLKLGAGPLPFAEPEFQSVDDFGYSIVHYLTDTEVWGDFFLPGLEDGFGRAWPLLLALAAAGLLGALFRTTSRRRLVALAGLAAIAAYVTTPASAFGAEGQPDFFPHNLRYAFPGLLVGLALLPTVRAARRTVAQLALLAGSAVVVAFAITSNGTGFKGLPGTHHRAGTLVAVLVSAVVAAALLGQRRRERIADVLAGRRPVLAVGALVLAVAGVASAFVLQDRFLDRRYRGLEQRDWVEGAEPTRIGFVGIDAGYLLHDRELRHHVQYIGDAGPYGEFHHIETCASWRQALADGDYDVVVHWRSPVYPDHIWEEFTSSDPAATLIVSVPDVNVYALSGDPDPATCPG